MGGLERSSWTGACLGVLFLGGGGGRGPGKLAKPSPQKTLSDQSCPILQFSHQAMRQRTRHSQDELNLMPGNAAATAGQRQYPGVLLEHKSVMHR